MIPHRRIAALAVATAHLPGCFQEEASRQGAPVEVADMTAVSRAGKQRSAEIAEVDDTAAVPELATMLSDSADPNVRRETIYTIADQGEAEDAAIIGQALYDSDSAVRLAAIEALTGIGGDTPSFLLEQALVDVNQGVREAAQDMLEEPAFARPQF